MSFDAILITASHAVTEKTAQNSNICMIYGEREKMVWVYWADSFQAKLLQEHSPLHMNQTFDLNAIFKLQMDLLHKSEEVHNLTWGKGVVLA